MSLDHTERQHLRFANYEAHRQANGINLFSFFFSSSQTWFLMACHSIAYAHPILLLWKPGKQSGFYLSMLTSQ